MGKSQRRIVPSFWNPWLVLRMRMVSSLTLHSWTNCAASKSNKPHPRSYQKTFLKNYIISNSSKICVTTSTLGQKHGGPKKPTKNRKYFLGTERHLMKMKKWNCKFNVNVHTISLCIVKKKVHLKKHLLSAKK